MNKFSLPKDNETNVDPDALRAFAAGAKEHKAGEPMPWESHDPEAAPRYNVSVRLNDYQLEQLRWLARQEDVSQQKILKRILIPILQEKVYNLT